MEYLKGKGLELNTKTKIIKFRRRGGRMEKRIWRGKEKRIEKDKEHKYLRYVVQRNGGQKAQIKDRVRRAAAVMGGV